MDGQKNIELTLLSAMGTHKIVLLYLTEYSGRSAPSEALFSFLLSYCHLPNYIFF
jgi:hypothetical protein